MLINIIPNPRQMRRALWHNVLVKTGVLGQVPECKRGLPGAVRPRDYMAYRSLGHFFHLPILYHNFRGGCAASPRLDVDDDYLRMVEETRQRRRFAREAAGDYHGRRVVEAICAARAPREQQPFAGSRAS